MGLEDSVEKVAIRAVPSFACAGVNWGVDQLKRILQEKGTVYITNQNGLVHYDPSMEELTGLGAVFVDDPRKIPTGAYVGDSMHGRSRLRQQTYVDQGLRHYDFSCPLVTNVHDRIEGAILETAKQGKVAKILYACKDPGHPEPQAVIDLAPNHIVPVTDRGVLENYQVRDDEEYFAESQTTINIKKAMELMMKFKGKFKGLRSLLPASSRLGACFATENRQQSLEAILNAGIDKLVVFGSPSSANTTQLAVIGKERGIEVDFLERAEHLDYGMFDGFRHVGVTGGASVPPTVGDQAMEIFRSWGFRIEDLVVGNKEPITFPNKKPPFYDYNNGHITEAQLAQLIRTH